jgi:hypothetical protein
MVHISSSTATFAMQEGVWKICKRETKFTLSRQHWDAVLLVCCALTNRLIRAGVHLPLRAEGWDPDRLLVPMLLD